MKNEYMYLTGQVVSATIFAAMFTFLVMCSLNDAEGDRVNLSDTSNIMDQP